MMAREIGAEVEACKILGRKDEVDKLRDDQGITIAFPLRLELR